MPGRLPRRRRLRRVLQVLARRTATPDELYLCFWDGWGVDLPGAVVDLPNLSYRLLVGGGGDLAEAATCPDPSRPQPAYR